MITDIYNTQSRIGIDKDTIGMLEDLLCNFLRILLATPASTPRAALVWDCGTFKMKFRIMQMKLNFLHYILTQIKDSLAHQILCEQRQRYLPGLVQERGQFIRDLSIIDPFKQWLSTN